MWRAYRRDRMAAIGMVLMLLFTVPFSLLFGIGAAVVLAKLDPVRAGAILTTGLLSTYAVWIIGPIVGFAFNESYDVSKLFGYPLSMRQIFAGARWGRWSTSRSCSLPPASSGSSRLRPQHPRRPLHPHRPRLFLVHVVSLSQTVLLLTSGFLSSRRFRDIMTVVMPLIAMSIYFTTQVASRRMINESNWQWPLEGRLPAFAHFVPPGIAAQAITEGAQGHWAAALVWLGALVAITVATLYAASWAVGLAFAGEVGQLGSRWRRRPEMLPRPTAPAAVSTSTLTYPARGAVRGLPPVMGAIIAKELAYVGRDPFYKLLMVNALYFIGVMIFAFWRAGEMLVEMGPRMLWFAPALLLFSMQVLNNLYGVEGAAASVLFGSPSPRRRLIMAKNLIFGLLFGGFALAVTIVGGLWLGAGVRTLLYALWVLLVLTVMTAAGNLISIYMPYRVVMRGWRMRASMGNRGCGYVFLYFGILLGTLVIMLPVFLGLWLPTRFDEPGLWIGESSLASPTPSASTPARYGSAGACCWHASRRSSSGWPPTRAWAKVMSMSQMVLVVSLCLAILTSIEPSNGASGRPIVSASSLATNSSPTMASSLTTTSSLTMTPKVDPGLFEALRRGGTADVLVLFGPSPDLAPARRERDKVRRARWVYDALRDAARRAQAPLIERLDRDGVPHQRFWIVNAVRTRLDAPSLAAVRRMAGVTQIVANRPHHGLAALPPGEEPEEPPPPPQYITNAIEWGVNRVEGPWAWGQGYRGQGVVVAGQDTGYDWDHPALTNTYRGYNPVTGLVSHNFNWHDSIHGDIGTPNGNGCGYNSPVPCDDHNHGTHTMGTMVGNDLSPNDPNWPAGAPNAVGLAPGAKWIGCRNMDNGDGIPSTYIECFEWFVAPYPIGGNPMTDGDPTKAPDVINNSWGCPSSEGCTGPEIEPALNAADAAGILVVVSAGNAGSACSTINDAPAMYPRSLSVGATNSGDNLAGFSSRGPVTYLGQTLAKPEISAPGVSVRSSIVGTGYATFQGTSMAGPHVAGAAALLMSADPALRGQTDLLKAILTRTSDVRLNNSCGGAPGGRPNHLYGWGIVNARHAIESLALPATLTGTVSSLGTNLPISGALVTLTLSTGDPITPTATATTDASGRYTMTVPTGGYDLEASHSGAPIAVAGPLYLVGGQAHRQDVTLALIIPGDCNGDYAVNAGDLSALTLELFDADGTLPENVPGGSYAGSAVGCNANGDGSVNAADMTCTVRLIFKLAGGCGP